MTKNNDSGFDAARAMADQFGPLSLTMLMDTDLSPIWRVSFLANFFTGPIYAELQDRFGLSRPGFVILFSLCHQDGLVARDICLVTGLPKNSISRAVTELEEKGLIGRDTDTADKRAKPLTLTAKGHALLAGVLPLFRERQAAMLAPLDRREAAEFNRLITKVVFAMPGWVAAG
ncbi:MarR family winged helix-turn-helix transcriptional regulator [Boseongicola sp. H5]|uniref:MarR family winged helix-turn-helix transcriptional regulator n=1 Tax=Boseongicola sp. H5 TaxID=2763261 RepID=UPI001D0A739A|nr:MarR family winged helix-turn-helix transcriptional regulator [Boseongicola sp. H5]